MSKKEVLRIAGIAAALVAVLILTRAIYPKLAAGYADRPPAASAETVPASAAPAETDAAEPEAEEPAAAAPDFTVQDGDGNAVSLSDFAGKPVVINFWATWCPPCRSELPAFDAAFATYGGDVEFLMVDLTDGSRETKEDVLVFMEEQGYRFPVYYDMEFSGAEAYGVRSIPMTVFVNADGAIAGGQIGAMQESALIEGLEALLGR